VPSAIGILLGLLVGLRHAFEPDHLTAVSTLVGETHDVRGGIRLGALWGIGHTISIVTVGVVLLLLGASLPARASAIFELGVAAMLLVLGARAIAIAVRGSDLHRAARHLHVAARGPGWRPLAVGLVHGLAGSGALTAIVFAELDGAGARVVYLALFGAGSIGGMAIASGIAGATLHELTRSERTRRWVGIATGLVSITVGVLWTIPLWLQLA
jgi:high-affinity nickel-transport protein